MSFLLDPVREKSFDISSIRDSFRQHIQTRRNTDEADLVLMDDELIQNLLALKQEAFRLLNTFKSINTKKDTQGVNTFSSFEEFVSFVMNQEEILNSELWKLEAIYNFLEENQLLNSSTTNASQRI